MISAVNPVGQHVGDYNCNRRLRQKWQRRHARPQSRNYGPQMAEEEFAPRGASQRNRDCYSGADAERMNKPAQQINQQRPTPPLVRARRRPLPFEKREQAHQQQELERRDSHRMMRAFVIRAPRPCQTQYFFILSSSRKRRLANEAAGHTLQPAALVHEAWLRLMGNQDARWEDGVIGSGLGVELSLEYAIAAPARTGVVAFEVAITSDSMHPEPIESLRHGG
jgi:hypothetical protein